MTRILSMPSPTPSHVGAAYGTLVAARADELAGRDERVSAREAGGDVYVADTHARTGSRRPSVRRLGREAGRAMEAEAARASGGDGRVSARDAATMGAPFAAAFRVLRGAPSESVSADLLLPQLKEAVRGLYYVSEADVEYTPFHVRLDSATTLDAENLKSLLTFDAEPPFELDLDNADSFWRDTAATMAEAGYPAAHQVQYRTLDRLMKEAFVPTHIDDGPYGLTGKVFVATPREECASSDALYIFGRLANGDLAGVKTERVWT
ncbi:MAG: hypothetical protein IPK13_16055 [Deltaproteobacteria bacterium]|nr:hypothetical protein [Deltaproteobacteria bacterium]